MRISVFRESEVRFEGTVIETEKLKKSVACACVDSKLSSRGIGGTLTNRVSLKEYVVHAGIKRSRSRAASHLEIECIAGR